MSFLKLTGGCLLAGALAVVVSQKSAISSARQENYKMRQGREEVARLEHENHSISELRLQNQAAESLRNSHQDLLKLRNEVRQLRAQSSEMEKLRQENQRLASNIKTLSSGKPPSFTEMKGFVPKESWSHSGFATPEAALQTLLWAVREGQIQAVAECMSPESRPWFEREFAHKSEEAKKKALQDGLGQLVQTGGYRLLNKEEVADDKVLLGIQAVAGGTVAKVVLRRFGNEWKFHDVDGAK